MAPTAASATLVTFDWEKEKDYDVALDRALFQHGMRRIG